MKYKVFNNKKQTFEEVDGNLVDDMIIAGEAVPVDDQDYPFINNQGKSVWVKGKDFLPALQLNWSYEKPLQEEVRKEVAQEGIYGAAKTFAANAADELLFGAPEIAAKNLVEKGGREDLLMKEYDKQNPKASAAGSLLGFGTNTALTLGLGLGAKVTSTAGKTASTVLKGNGILSKAGQTALKGGMEGAAYSAPVAFTELLTGDPTTAGEMLLAGTLFGAGLEGVPKLAKEGSKKIGKKLTEVQFTDNIIKSFTPTKETVVTGLGNFTNLQKNKWMTKYEDKIPEVYDAIIRDYADSGVKDPLKSFSFDSLEKKNKFNLDNTGKLLETTYKTAEKQYRELDPVIRDGLKLSKTDLLDNATLKLKEDGMTGLDLEGNTIQTLSTEDKKILKKFKGLMGDIEVFDGPDQLWQLRKKIGQELDLFKLRKDGPASDKRMLKFYNDQYHIVNGKIKSMLEQLDTLKGNQGEGLALTFDQANKTYTIEKAIQELVKNGIKRKDIKGLGVTNPLDFLKGGIGVAVLGPAGMAAPYMWNRFISNTPMSSKLQDLALKGYTKIKDSAVVNNLASELTKAPSSYNLLDKAKTVSKISTSRMLNDLMDLDIKDDEELFKTLETLDKDENYRRAAIGNMNAKLGMDDFNEPLYNQASKMINYLAKNAPKTSQLQDDPFYSGKFKPSFSDYMKFKEIENLVMNPLSILDKIKDNKLLPKDVETVRTVYPELFKSIQSTIMSDIFSKNLKIHKKRMPTLNTLFGPKFNRRYKYYNQLQNNFLISPEAFLKTGEVLQDRQEKAMGYEEAPEQQMAGGRSQNININTNRYADPLAKLKS